MKLCHFAGDQWLLSLQQVSVMSLEDKTPLLALTLNSTHREQCPRGQRQGLVLDCKHNITNNSCVGTQPVNTGERKEARAPSRSHCFLDRVELHRPS